MATAQPAAKNSASTHNQVAEIIVEAPYALKDKGVYNIPAVCTCCLAPTDNKVTFKWGESRKYTSGVNRVTEIHTASLDFCVCPDCVAHEQEYNRKKTRMIMISVLISSIVSTLLIYMFNDELEALFGGSMVLYFLIVIVLAPTVMAMPVLATLDILIPQRVLDRRHASRLAGVRMSGPRRYEFDNLVYAQLFVKLNDENAKFTDMIGKQHDSPYKITQTIKKPHLQYKVFGKSLLESGPLVEILGTTAFVSSVLTFLFSMAIFCMTEPPTAGSPGSYICSGLLFIIVITACLQEWKKG